MIASYFLQGYTQVSTPDVMDKEASADIMPMGSHNFCLGTNQSLNKLKSWYGEIANMSMENYRKKVREDNAK